jgi:hypothetical protein
MNDRVSGESEGLRFGIVFENAAFDCCAQAADRKIPRFNRRLVSLAKKSVTAMSHEANLGVSC